MSVPAQHTPDPAYRPWNDAALVAEVHAAPVPDLVPQDLAAVLRPVRAGGQIVDWQLAPAGLESRPEELAPRLEAYRRWRVRWRPAYQLGPVSSVEEFIEFATTAANAIGAPLPTLASLRLSGDSLENGRALSLKAELSVARELVAGSAQRGWGLLDLDAKRITRTVAATRGPVVLHQVGSAQVRVRNADGFLLADDERIHLAQWGLRPPDSPALTAGLWVQGVDGTERVVTGDAARVLQQLAPAAARVRVKQIPLVSVWAAVIVGLAEAAAAAVTAKAVLGPLWP